MSVSAPLVRLRDLKNKLIVARRSLGHHIARSPDGRSAVALFGQARHADRLIHDYLGHDQPVVSVATLSWPSGPFLLNLARAHGLAVFHGNYVPRKLRHRILHLPVFVSMTREINGSIEQLRAGLPTRSRINLNHLERKGFQVVINRNPSALAEFHADHHRPAMLNRHGKNAYIVPLANLHDQMQRGGAELLQVFDGQHWIAGLYGSFSPEEGYRIEKFGWRGGDPDIVKTGALKLLYWQAIVRASELGLGRLNFGYTPASLEDGIFFQKSRWGARLETSSISASPEWRLLLDPSHPQVRCFLSRHSLVLPNNRGRFHIVSGRSPGGVPAYGSQADRISAWYRLRDTPLEATSAASHNQDLPPGLRPWFDSVSLGTPAR